MGVASEGSGDDTFIEEIYQQIEPALLEETKRTFKPWHKPRKHYLRVRQWCSLLQALIGEIGYREGDMVRYLGLPGEDFLDVRTLEGVCNRAKLKLQYLGFDSSADATAYETNLSKHEISSLGFVDPFSVLARDRIEGLAAESSTAREIFERLGPFDVINLDICDSVVGAVGAGSYFDALGKLCDLQIRCGRTKPWLLFLSTRAIRDQFQETAKLHLIECILHNLSGSAEFADKLSAELSLTESQLRREMTQEEMLEHSILVKALSVGLGKWLLKLTMSAAPKVSIRLLQSYSYRVEIAQPDMLSLAFRFEPIIEPRIDSTGLAPASVAAAGSVTETELAIDLVGEVANIKDIDQLLADDSELFERFVTSCGKILVSARYDEQAFREWVANSPTFGSASQSDRGIVPPRS